MTPNGILGLEDFLAALGDLPENLRNRAVRAWAIRRAREVARAARAPGEALPGILGLGLVGGGRGEDRHFRDSLL